MDFEARRKGIVERKIYASDGEIHLVRLEEEDKEMYMALKRSVSSVKHWYDDPELRKMLWESAIDGEDLDYSIYNGLDEYCGNVVLQNPSGATPELGVDLVEEKRNQGLAERAIKLLAKQVYEECPVDYFVLRVSSENPHSRHMIEKMGAVLEEEEESRWQRLKHVLGLIAEGDEFEDLTTKFADYMSEDEVVYRYRLLPEMILEK